VAGDILGANNESEINNYGSDFGAVGGVREQAAQAA